MPKATPTISIPIASREALAVYAAACALLDTADPVHEPPEMAGLWGRHTGLVLGIARRPATSLEDLAAKVSIITSCISLSGDGTPDGGVVDWLAWSIAADWKTLYPQPKTQAT
jgi:hypothetical protein